MRKGRCKKLRQGLKERRSRGKNTGEKEYLPRSKGERGAKKGPPFLFEGGGKRSRVWGGFPSSD